VLPANRPNSCFLALASYSSLRASYFLPHGIRSDLIHSFVAVSLYC
jgi:hypothetical protein